MTENWKEQLASELNKPLPGVDAQLRMSPAVRRPVTVEYQLKSAGVLILLYPHIGRIYTVFIKRTEYEGVHSGQVSLPGGMFEEKDGSFMNTALREANEETGIDISSVTIIGKLTPLHIPVSNVNVHAFVGVTDSRPVFIHDPSEVQYLIEESLDELMNEVNRKTRAMTLFGNEVIVPYFDIRGNHIWGATAMIISEFAEIMRKVTRDE